MKFQTPRRKAGVPCPWQAKQPYRCIKYFKGGIFRRQPRANPTNRPSVDNCLRPAMISLFCVATAAEREMGPKPQRECHSEILKLIPQNWKCSIFSYKNLVRIKPTSHSSSSASSSFILCLHSFIELSIP